MRVFLLLSLLLMAVLTVSLGIPIKRDYSKSIAMSSGRTARFPIRIFGNEDFLQQAADNGWPGTGSEEDPIIIERYIIRNVSHAAYIYETDLHFVFCDNIIEGIGKTWCAIVTFGVRNAVFVNNTIRYGAVGVHAINTNESSILDNVMYDNRLDGVFMELSSSNNIISGNTFHHNPEAGVFVWRDCHNITISDNKMHHSSYGAILRIATEHSTIERNDIHTCYEAGIGLSSGHNLVRNNSIYEVGGNGIQVNSENNTIESNLIHNTECGLELSYGSAHTEVINNVFINNTEYGVLLRYTKNNTLEHNDFYENGETHQVCDNGTDTTFHQNYWHQWIGADDGQDGFIDTAHVIYGNSSTVDTEPLAAPCNPVPSWYSFIPVTPPPSQEDPGYEWPLLSSMIAGGVLTIGIITVLVKKRKRG